MSALEDFEDFIRVKVEKEKWTHEQISAFLKGKHHRQRGFSVRSIERFCSYRSIHKTPQIDDQKLDEAVSRAADMVSNVLEVHNYNGDKIINETLRACTHIL